MKTDGKVYDLNNGILRFFPNVECYEIINELDSLIKAVHGMKLDIILVPISIKKEWKHLNIEWHIKECLYPSEYGILFYEL